MKQFFKKNINIVLFSLVATLFIGIAYTSADFFTAPAHEFSDRLILFFQWASIIIGILPVFYLMSLSKYVFAVFYPLICLLSSILMYFRYTIGTIFTTMIFDAVLDNDTRITGELISFWLVFIMIISVLIAGFFVIYRFKKIKKIAYLPFHIVFALAWFYLIFQLPRIERPMTERIPMNLYFIPAQYFEEKKEILKHRAEFEGQVFCSENKPIVVLIIGETLRADHLGLNGYERNTTPMLEKEDVISFQNIYSEETNTSPSVAHILTRADSIHPELAYSERSFVDLFKKCGYYTMWLANQEPAGAYIYFMQECDTLIYGQINKSYYSWDKWTDELLLPPFDSITQSTDESRLIIMHTIGSHWYYNTHFTADFQRFNPITKSRITSSNTSEEMINSYDNTVLFTDYFIVQVISRLKNKNAVVFYLSDHGEALGENGVWLHANNVEGAHKPACMVWLSEKYKADNTQRYKTLKQNAQKHYRTDFVFHTILESANIESEVINKEMSLFY